jgi:hypothetical protein
LLNGIFIELYLTQIHAGRTKKKAPPAKQIGLYKSNHFYQFTAGGIAVGTTLRTGFVLFKYLKMASISSCFMAT